MREMMRKVKILIATVVLILILSSVLPSVALHASQGELQEAAAEAHVEAAQSGESVGAAGKGEENESVGILVIAHGSPRETWCEPVREVVRSVASELPYPVELGFLEFVPNETINIAVDRLNEHNVTKIVAVPLFISSHSGHMEEIKYVLRLRETPPASEMLTFVEGKPVRRSVLAVEGKCIIRREYLTPALTVKHTEEEELVPVNTTAEIILTSALDNSSLLAQTLAENAAELISDAENETVVFASHGTFNASYLEEWIADHESLAEQIKLILRHRKGIPIEDVRFGFIHLPVVDNKTVHPELGLRAVVENVSVNSTPVVVANMVSVGFFTKKYIPMLLENLTYKYNGSKALCPHENMVKWVEISANKEISTFVLQIYDYDGETLLNITIEEVGEHHGEICPCVAAAFRATQLAFSEFESIPVRGDIKVICAHPSKGHKQTFEYIFGGENLKIELPAGTDIVNLSVENYAYTFIQKSSGHEVRVEAREDIFPERFFDLRKKCKTGTATSEEKKAFKYAKEDLKSAFLYLPEARVFAFSSAFIFDTGEPANPYPSISGVHKGAIIPASNISVSKMLIYPCVGTGGHAESVKIYNESFVAVGNWDGYRAGDWKIIKFEEPFTLFANETYFYEIRTGSYPQIHHKKALNATGGWINCTSFVDANNRKHDNWIPAFKLF